MKKHDGEMAIYKSQTDDLQKSQQHDPLLRYLTHVIVKQALQLQPPHNDTRVIDIGCGIGRTSLALAKAGYSVSGVDPSRRIINLGEKSVPKSLTKRISFHTGDATKKLPSKWEGHFDIAVCSEVIEHVDTPEHVISYAHTALRPGGLLIFTTPHSRDQWTVMDDYAGHITRFSKEELLHLFEDFNIISLTTEGFPFQRLVMQLYHRLLTWKAGTHAFNQFGDSLPYRMYARFMPIFLSVDHFFRHLHLGTTLVVVARRHKTVL